VVRPRRYSVEQEELGAELARQRVIYSDNSTADPGIAGLLTSTSANPSTPLDERLDELVSLLLGAPYLSETGVATASGQTLTGSVDFEVEGVQVGDIVRVDSGPNRGFYAITAVTSTELTVDGSSDFVTYALVDDAATSYTVSRADVFELRTYQLVLSEQFGVGDLIARIDEALAAISTDVADVEGTTPFGTLTGDFTAACVDAHQAAVSARLDRIRDVSPTLTQDVEGVLRGAEALYDVRFAWVDYRTSLVSGTLPRIRQYLARVEERRAKRLRDLTRLLSTGGG